MLEELFEKIRVRLKWFLSNGVFKLFNKDVAEFKQTINETIKELKDLLEHIKKIKDRSNVIDISFSEIDEILNSSDIIQQIESESDIDGKVEKLGKLLQKLLYIDVEALLKRLESIRKMEEERHIKAEELSKFDKEMLVKLLMLRKTLSESFEKMMREYGKLSQRYQWFQEISKIQSDIEVANRIIRKSVAEMASGFMEVLEKSEVDRNIVSFFRVQDIEQDMVVSADTAVETIQKCSKEELKRVKPEELSQTIMDSMKGRMDKRLEKVREEAQKQKEDNANLVDIKEHPEKINDELEKIRKIHKKYLDDSKSKIHELAEEAIHRQELNKELELKKTEVKMKDVEFEKRVDALKAWKKQTERELDEDIMFKYNDTSNSTNFTV